ncbi:MAG: radical SAM protein [Deltaproteobacteria bacterium]|nr:radical SAM protein [Deltaproteobacteria bacterium]
MPDQRPRRPLIIPIFIPNQGCPHRCIFCQQEEITGQRTRPVSGRMVQEIIEIAIRSQGFHRATEPEVAFYGGTFTRLPAEKMEELLGAVTPYIHKGYFRSVRVSTRPDAVNEKQLDRMKHLGVSTVELGAQSMDNRVLEMSRRGHTAGDTIRAFRLLRKYGFRVGLQLMPGLPGDTETVFMSTISQVIDLHPDMVRLYPALVIRGTELEAWYLCGRYRPLSLDVAVRICREGCMALEGAGIPVIRIGLMSSPSLREQGAIAAGPWHEAFGFLVRSEIYHRRIAPCLPKPGEAKRIRLKVHWKEASLLRGHRNSGLRLIEEKTGARIEELSPVKTLGPGEIEVERL